MREIFGPDSLFVIEVEMCEEASGDVLSTLHNTYPESVALENITDTHVTVFSRENGLLIETHQLLQAGKVTKYTVK